MGVILKMCVKHYKIRLVENSLIGNQKSCLFFSPKEDITDIQNVHKNGHLLYHRIWVFTCSVTYSSRSGSTFTAVGSAALFPG